MKSKTAEIAPRRLKLWLSQTYTAKINNDESTINLHVVQHDVSLLNSRRKHRQQHCSMTPLLRPHLEHEESLLDGLHGDVSRAEEGVVGPGACTNMEIYQQQEIRWQLGGRIFHTILRLLHPITTRSNDNPPYPRTRQCCIQVTRRSILLQRSVHWPDWMHPAHAVRRSSWTATSSPCGCTGCGLPERERKRQCHLSCSFVNISFDNSGRSTFHATHTSTHGPDAPMDFSLE